MYFNGIESTTASTLDAAALSGEDRLYRQFGALVDAGDYEETDDSWIAPTEDPAIVEEVYSNW